MQLVKFNLFSSNPKKSPNPKKCKSKSKSVSIEKSDHNSALVRANNTYAELDEESKAKVTFFADSMSSKGLMLNAKHVEKLVEKVTLMQVKLHAVDEFGKGKRRVDALKSASSARPSWPQPSRLARVRA